MKPLTQAQAEQLQEITQHLLRVREEKSITIEEIAIQTNIRLSILKALDAGDFQALPEPIYVQGFIRRYGEVIGLDGQALAHTFKINDYPEYSYNESPHSAKKLNIHIPLLVPYALLLVLASVGLIYILNSKLTPESQAQPQNAVPTQETKTKP